MNDFYFLNYLCCGLSGDCGLAALHFVPLNLTLAFALISGINSLVISSNDTPVTSVT